MQEKMPFNYGSSRGEIQIQRTSELTYNIDDQASLKVLISDQMVCSYADQYGDRNPIHLDDQAGAASVFKARIAHGMLSFNFFSTLLGAGFPGPGTIFTGVPEWRFTTPVKIGDELTLEVKIASCREKSNGSYDLVFDAHATKHDGTSVMSGKLRVIAPQPH